MALLPSPSKHNSALFSPPAHGTARAHRRCLTRVSQMITRLKAAPPVWEPTSWKACCGGQANGLPFLRETGARRGDVDPEIHHRCEHTLSTVPNLGRPGESHPRGARKGSQSSPGAAAQDRWGLNGLCPGGNLSGCFFFPCHLPTPLASEEDANKRTGAGMIPAH